MKRVLVSLIVLATFVHAPLPAVASAVPAAAKDCKLAAPKGMAGYLSEGFPTASWHPSAVGTVKALTLYVDFADALAGAGSGARTIDEEHALLFPEAAAYFASASGGRLKLEITSHRKWVRMPKKSTEYSNSEHATLKALLTDALKIATEKEKVDLAPYHVVYLVPSSKQTTMALSPTFIVPPELAIKIGRKKINAAVAFGADRWEVRRGHRVTIHEMGHIFGLPDLYLNTDDQEARFTFVGAWDVMSNMSMSLNFLVWHKWKLGWLDDSRITCVTGKSDTTFDIERNGAATGTQAVVIKLSSTTAYVVETRAHIGHDACQCREGVLIYFVDTTVATMDGPVRVFAAEEAPDGVCDPYVKLGGLAWAPYGAGEGRQNTFAVDPNVTVTVQRTTPDGPATVRVQNTSTE